MPNAPIIELADLVTSDLNGAGLGITAVRSYLPLLERADIATLRVLVIPKTEASQPSSRSAIQSDYRIDIGVIQALDTGADDSFSNTQLDALMLKVQQIKDRLKFRPLGDYAWVRTENDPLVSTDRMAAERQFTSLITVTYRKVHE